MLVKSGYLKLDSERKNKISKRPQDEERQRFYVIPASAFNGIQREEKKTAPVDKEDKRNGVIIDGVFRSVKM